MRNDGTAPKAFDVYTGLALYNVVLFAGKRGFVDFIRGFAVSR
jgi:hypothetical protein